MVTYTPTQTRARSSTLSSLKPQVSHSEGDSHIELDLAALELLQHNVHVVDFALKTQQEQEAKRSKSKSKSKSKTQAKETPVDILSTKRKTSVLKMVYNPKAKYTKRGKFMVWLEDK